MVLVELIVLSFYAFPFHYSFPFRFYKQRKQSSSLLFIQIVHIERDIIYKGYRLLFHYTLFRIDLGCDYLISRLTSFAKNIIIIS